MTSHKLMTSPLSAHENRRKFRRAPMTARAQCLVNGITHEVVVDNVSESGLRMTGLKGDADEKPLKIFLPVRHAGVGRKRLCLFEGQVAWRAGDAVGVTFSFPAETVGRELKDYVRAICPR